MNPSDSPLARSEFVRLLGLLGSVAAVSAFLQACQRAGLDPIGTPTAATPGPASTAASTPTPERNSMTDATQTEALDERTTLGVCRDSGSALALWSERMKADVLRRLKPDSPLVKYRDMLSSPDYDVFHRAGTLIIICARPDTHNGAEDCSLAAQNLMLAACSMGLGTCPIGFARPWLSQRKIKQSLGIPDGYAPVFPVVLGFPSGETPPVPRRAPEILLWQ